MNHLPGGSEVQDHRGGIAVGDFRGDGEEVFRFAYEQFGEGSVNGQSSYTLTHLESGDTRTNGLDHAGELITWDERYRGSVAVVSRQQGQVGRAHPGGAHPYIKLARSWGSNGQIDDLESFGSAFPGQHHGPISRCHLYTFSDCTSLMLMKEPSHAVRWVFRSCHGSETSGDYLADRLPGNQGPTGGLRSGRQAWRIRKAAAADESGHYK